MKTNKTIKALLVMIIISIAIMIVNTWLDDMMGKILITIAMISVLILSFVIAIRE